MASLKFLSEADQRRLMICLQNMRMSCDSTYLLDHRRDWGVKADELAILLDELLEQPGSKVVVFSQWVRMLELRVRRLRRSASSTCCSTAGSMDRSEKDSSIASARMIGAARSCRPMPEASD